MVVAFIKFTTSGIIKCLAGSQKLSAVLSPVREKGAWIKENDNDKKENKS